YPDHFAFDSKSKYFDPKSKLESPTWFMVDIKFKKQFKKQVSLTEIKASKDLAKMKLIQKGTRLSIQPLTKEEFQYLLKMAGE
ncbi:MAG: EVE domain-containing protein, partial [Leptospiraceae bacterium]|nr:EVE domain-containing protein [Leptospiraceae bacterium]